jgi:hypothetical protein
VKEVVLVFRNDIDQVLLQRFLVGPRLRLAHGALRQLHVAAARPDKRAHEGSRIVFHFRLHHVVHLLAAQDDGMGRARVCSRRHRGNVGRLENEEAGRGGIGAGGRDIDDDGHRRSQNLLDDLARGIDQAAGRTQLDEHGISIGLPRMLDGAVDVLGADGLDGVIQANFDNRGRERVDRSQQKQDRASD